jgi:hypothetical protein
MKTTWLIEFTADLPAVYIAAEGGITYRATKAKQYESRALAESRIEYLKLPDTWKAIAHVVASNDRD